MVLKSIILIIIIYTSNIASAIDIYEYTEENKQTEYSRYIFKKYQIEQPTPLINGFNNTPLTTSI